MFKNYHIVIFKDREGAFRKLRLGGWIGAGLLLLLAALTVVGLSFWNFYTRTQNLEQELADSQKQLRAQESQVLSLTGKLKGLEEDVLRVQQFDAKLRVLMNIEQEGANLEADERYDH
ncbi:peptidase M24, partial [Desulfovibrio sp. OttesenSCG-928-F20]|nr:peptidase M24 [Desulfovibrio sp. OttesenSCG-928-F20]